MLYLDTYRTELSKEAIPRLLELMTETGTLLQPLLQPTLATPASILGVAGSDPYEKPTHY